MTVYSQSRLMQRLGERRVREDHHTKVFGAGAEFHRNGALLNQLGSTWANDMHAENAVSLGIGNDLDETSGFVGGHRPSAGRERSDADVDVNPFGLQLLLGLADPCDFRVGVDDARDQVVVHLGLVTGDTLSNHHALFRGLVGQHRTAYHVTDGINARYAGRAEVVDEHEAALIHGPATVGGQQIGGYWTTAHSDDQLVEGQLLFAGGVSKLHSDLLALDFRAGNTSTQTDVKTLLGENLLGFLGNLIIGGRQELVHGFD